MNNTTKTINLVVVECDYCFEPAECITGAQAYPHRPDLRDKILWRCEGCDAHVGCHPGSTRPLGRLAKADLRAAKMQAHAAFDPIWKRGTLSRKGAYKWLAQELDIPAHLTHIGMFDVDLCERCVEACNEYKRERCW